MSLHPGIHGLIRDELHLNRYLRIDIFGKKPAHFTPGPVLNFSYFLGLGAVLGSSGFCPCIPDTTRKRCPEIESLPL